MHCILLICQKEYSPATPSMVLLPFVLGMIFLLSFETLIEGVAEEGCGDGEDIFIIQVDNTTQYQAYAAKFGKNNVKIVNKHSLQVYASCENMRYHHYHHHQQPQYERKEPTEKLHQHFLHANKQLREFDLKGNSIVQFMSFVTLNESGIREELREEVLEIEEIEVDARHLDNIITINLPNNKVRQIITKLSELKFVAWIEMRQPIRSFNKFAKGVIESGFAGSRFLSKANFTGDGHVVGVSDTGIDVNHCFFKDTSNSVVYNSLNSRHRKIVYYQTYVDSQDDVHGHGTHVAASLAGSYGNHGKKHITFRVHFIHSISRVFCFPCHTFLITFHSDYNGMLSNAKLAFFDIGDATTQYLSIPSNLASQMLLPMYRAGARIFSNSWGAYGETANYYSMDARSIDVFMHNYPESLVLFAAGNEGTGGYNTVVSPSLNKNGISIGSSCNDAASFSMNNDLNSYDHLHINNDNDDDLSPPNFTVYNEDVLFMKSLMLNKDKNENENKVSSSNIVDRVAYFSSKGPTADGRLKPDIVGPGWSIVSAGCGTSCGLSKMRGTSMATPIVAAAAVHIKDYFQRGFYPTGKANNNYGFIPSGALIKAMLIHGAVSISDVANSDGSVSSLDGYSPNSDVGYGRVQLNKILNFGSSSGVSLIVIGSAYQQNQRESYTKNTKFTISRDENMTISKFSSSSNIYDDDFYPPIYVSLNRQNSYFTYQFNSGSCSKSSDCSIRLTMAYTDIVGSADGDQILLNDLDMIVSSESGDKFRPSSAYEKGPLESLTIQEPVQNMNYTVSIYAQTLYTSQPFSLVITGNIVQYDNGFDWNESVFGLWSWITGENSNG